MIQLLLVEDEAWIRKGILKHIPFYDLGIGNVQAVQNAAEALELCKGGFVPDILLSDIRMPGMSGTEMAAMIKERNPRCKIIFISGYSDKEYLTTAIKLQVVGYIEKPIDLEVLKDTLLQAVNQIRLMKMQRRTLLHRLLFSLNTETVMPFSKKERIVVLFLLKSKDEIFGMYDVAKSLEQAMSALFRGHTATMTFSVICMTHCMRTIWNAIFCIRNMPKCPDTRSFLRRHSIAYRKIWR